MGVRGGGFEKVAPVKAKYKKGEATKEEIKLIKAAFMHRRKTLVNSVASGLGIKKEDIIKALLSLNISETIRPEQLSLEQFANLSNILG